jgi:hypothetical protein
MLNMTPDYPLGIQERLFLFSPGVTSETDSFVNAPSCRDRTSHAEVRERDGDGVRGRVSADAAADPLGTLFRDCFQRDRDGNPKGIIVIDLEDFE